MWFVVARRLGGRRRVLSRPTTQPAAEALGNFGFSVEGQPAEPCLQTRGKRRERGGRDEEKGWGEKRRKRGNGKQPLGCWLLG
jgi:hypothetical protein